MNHQDHAPTKDFFIDLKLNIKNTNMNYKTIKALQTEHGYNEMQSIIDSGLAWRLEGSIGRQAMQLLEYGACMLPKRSHHDVYGNYIPSRDELEPGSKGTFQNSVKFYISITDNI